MRLASLVLAASLAAGLAPAVASAQGAPPPPPGPGLGGYPTASPEQRAAMEKARADFRSAAFAALTPAHRTQVQGIVDDLNAGKTGDPRAAAQQIDALLTPDETKGVLAARDRLVAALPRRDGMPPRPERSPDAAAPNGEQRRGGWMNDAGMALVRLSLTPERARALRDARMRGEGAPPPPPR